jgi:hypothetical protein
MMQHPLEFLPMNLRKPFFYFFLIFTLPFSDYSAFWTNPANIRRAEWNCLI